MFNLGGGELILIGLLAIILIPPKKIPEVAVSLGKFFRQLQHGFDEVKTSMEKSLKSTDEEKSQSDKNPS